MDGYRRVQSLECLGGLLPLRPELCSSRKPVNRAARMQLTSCKVFVCYWRNCSLLINMDLVNPPGRRSGKRRRQPPRGAPLDPFGLTPRACFVHEEMPPNASFLGIWRHAACPCKRAANSYRPDARGCRWEPSALRKSNTLIVFAIDGARKRRGRYTPWIEPPPSKRSSWDGVTPVRTMPVCVTAALSSPSYTSSVSAPVALSTVNTPAAK